MAPAAAAEALRITYGTLRNIEGVEGRPVSLRVIHRAARLYQCSSSWLQGLDDTPPAPPTVPEPKPKREPAGDPSGPAPRREGKDNRRGPARADLAAAS